MHDDLWHASPDEAATWAGTQGQEQQQWPSAANGTDVLGHEPEQAAWDAQDWQKPQQQAPADNVGGASATSGQAHSALDVFHDGGTIESEWGQQDWRMPQQQTPADNGGGGASAHPQQGLGAFDILDDDSAIESQWGGQAEQSDALAQEQWAAYARQAWQPRGPEPFAPEADAPRPAKPAPLESPSDEASYANVVASYTRKPGRRRQPRPSKATDFAADDASGLVVSEEVDRAVDAAAARFEGLRKHERRAALMRYERSALAHALAQPDAAAHPDDVAASRIVIKPDWPAAEVALKNQRKLIDEERTKVISLVGTKNDGVHVAWASLQTAALDAAKYKADPEPRTLQDWAESASALHREMQQVEDIDAVHGLKIQLHFFMFKDRLLQKVGSEDGNKAAAEGVAHLLQAAVLGLDSNGDDTPAELLLCRLVRLVRWKPQLGFLQSDAAVCSAAGVLVERLHTLTVKAPHVSMYRFKHTELLGTAHAIFDVFHAPFWRWLQV